MKGFNEIYQKIYQENGEELEQMRKKAKNEIIWVVLITIIIEIVLCNMTKSPIPVFIGIIIITFYFALSKKKNKYKKIFKETVIKQFIQEYSEELKYEPSMGIQESIYRQGKFELYDRYHTEDLILGTLEDGSEIYMAEVHTEMESTDDDGGTTYTTLFHGLFAQITLNKIVPTELKVRKNALTLFGNKEKIEMDSQEFEKKFNVFATDKIVAMQLLTSDTMQMILDFKEKMKLSPEITLIGDKLYIRFATGNVFEANLIKSSLNFDTLKKYYDIINFTLKLTEEFIKNINETEM